ncbi:T9SS type A sorting domain-containing protein, partial [Flavobacterium sp. MK4S-17]|uniref:Ig-like domain-containing protein n=1 Tax=Flavobacterium sp. MK4S-17 TaxID=2543737 RepID=UPI00135C31C5
TEALADDTVLTTGTYYVAQIVGTCESPRAAVEVTVNELPVAPVAAAQVFCGNGTVGELEADIEDVLWYADETSTEALADDTVLTTGTYYVAQLVGTCESTRAAVEVTVNAVPDAPTGSETQQFTAGETLADLEVAGTNVAWYEDEALTIMLADTTPLVDQATYYAAQVEGECISDFLAVTVSEIMATDVFTLSQLQFYPNPVKNELNLSFAGEINTVSVFNMLGQVVADKQVNATDCKVDLSHLQAGTYLLRVTSGKGERTIKIVKD